MNHVTVDVRFFKMLAHDFYLLLLQMLMNAPETSVDVRTLVKTLKAATSVYVTEVQYQLLTTTTALVSGLSNDCYSNTGSLHWSPTSLLQNWESRTSKLAVHSLSLISTAISQVFMSPCKSYKMTYLCKARPIAASLD